jgi:hypothetical protein
VEPPPLEIHTANVKLLPTTRITKKIDRRSHGMRALIITIVVKVIIIIIIIITVTITWTMRHLHKVPPIQVNAALHH